MEGAYGASFQNGYLWVVGETYSNNLPVTTGAQQGSFGGGSSDAFVGRYTGTLTNFYLTYLGGSGRDRAMAAASDPDGNLYVAGGTASTNFPITTGVYQSTAPAGDNAFVARVNIQGQLVWSTYLGGDSSDIAYGVAVRDCGVSVVGKTFGLLPGQRAVQPAFGGVNDGFLTRLKTDGTGLHFSTYLGGISEDAAYAVAVDRTGDAYLTGKTISADFPLVNPLQATGGTAFVTKITPWAV